LEIFVGTLPLKALTAFKIAASTASTVGRGTGPQFGGCFQHWMKRSAVAKEAPLGGKQVVTPRIAILSSTRVTRMPHAMSTKKTITTADRPRGLPGAARGHIWPSHNGQGRQPDLGGGVRVPLHHRRRRLAPIFVQRLRRSGLLRRSIES
jgi:hypothetical protein